MHISTFGLGLDLKLSFLECIVESKWSTALPRVMIYQHGKDGDVQVRLPDCNLVVIVPCVAKAPIDGVPTTAHHTALLKAEQMLQHSLEFIAEALHATRP